MLIYKKTIVDSITTTPGLPSFSPPPKKKKIPPLRHGRPQWVWPRPRVETKAYVVRLQERSGLFEVLELEVAAAPWFVGFFAHNKKKHRFFSMGGFPVSALDIWYCISKSSKGVLLLWILYDFGVGFLVLEIKPFGICGMFGSSRISVRVLVWPNNRSC